MIQSAAYPQTVSSVNGLKISAEALKAELSAAGETRRDLDILIYGYTPDTEAYTLAPDETLVVTIRPGEIRALVRKMSNGELKKAIFVSGQGTDEQSMLKSLAEAIIRLNIE